MIIDRILDRYDGHFYKSQEFYRDMLDYEADSISNAMDY